MTETRNAIITDARIFIEDHGILTFFIDLDYGGQMQDFGGYDVRTNLGVWVQDILNAFEVDDWNKLKGKPCRARLDDSRLIRSIGNLIKEKWVTPPTKP